MKICLSTPNTLGYPDGGHLWVFLNWALGFRSLGHEVVWLDVVDTTNPPPKVAQLLDVLRERLAIFGLDQSIALCTPDGEPYEYEADLKLLPLEQAFACDVLCDHRYNLPARVVNGFKKSMLIDIDPGQLHVALDLGTYRPALHTSYFTVGEWVKFIDEDRPSFNTHGLDWQYTPPPVALDAWPAIRAADGAALTTVSNWYMANEWMPDEHGNWYDNSKRAAFQSCLDIPKESPIPLELCLNIGNYQPEIDLLTAKGWRIVKSSMVSHPTAYRNYIQQSAGEFSVAKPAYVKMKTGWLSDRTACYLASGKPVVVEKTGRSDLFPDDCGTLRFTDPAGAKRCLELLASDYDKQAKAARALAEEHLDAKKVLRRILEKCV